MPSDVSLHRLADCEAVIKRGLATFVEVGAALLEIRDGRLYRETHTTFEAYCAGRWGFTDRRARQLMDAAEIGTIVPVLNEGQARELSPLRGNPEAMREVWAEVSEDAEPVTAKFVKAAVERRLPQKPTAPIYPVHEMFACPRCAYEGERVEFRKENANGG